VKALFIGSVVVLALAVPAALAADLSLPVKPMSAPPPPPVANWTGCYVNGGGGYGMWNQDGYIETFPAPFVPVTTNGTSGGRGWFGMAGGGCDYQLNVYGAGLVIGGFGDFDSCIFTARSRRPARLLWAMRMSAGPGPRAAASVIW
jgi:outer membrane immunogenic protein